MSATKRTQNWDRTRQKAADQIKPMAAQMKPLAKSTGEAARRQWFRARAWAAPRVEHTGKVLQETVAPKVSDALSGAANRIDPAKPKRGRWRLPAGIAAVLAAAASGAAAVIRKRSKKPAAGPAGETTGTGETGETGEAGSAGQAKTEPVSQQDTQANVR